MLVWSTTLLAAGSLLATLVRSHSQLAVLTDIGAIAISTLGGALLPLSMMPAIAQHAAPASPGYWAISMLKAAVRGHPGQAAWPLARLRRRDRPMVASARRRGRSHPAGWYH
jgi:ABC-2 type transport system permease protein